MKIQAKEFPVSKRNLFSHLWRTCKMFYGSIHAAQPLHVCPLTLLPLSYKSSNLQQYSEIRSTSEHVGNQNQGRGQGCLCVHFCFTYKYLFACNFQDWWTNPADNQNQVCWMYSAHYCSPTTHHHGQWPCDGASGRPAHGMSACLWHGNILCNILKKEFRFLLLFIHFC